MPTDIPEINQFIDTKVRKERDRSILRRVLVDGISYERVAEEHDVCRTTVYTVVHKYRIE